MKNASLIAFSLFLLLSLTYIITPFWHSYPLLEIDNVGLFLESYPTQHTDNNICFTIGFKVPEKSLGTNPQYKIYINHIIQEYGNFTLTNGSKTYCLNNIPDTATIKYELDSVELFFHTNKTKEIKETKVQILDINKEGILLQTENPQKYIPIKIYQDGILTNLIQPKEGTSFEKIDFEKESISILYNNTLLKETNLEQESQTFPFFFGALLFCLVFLSYLLFFKDEFYLRIAKSFGAISIFTILSVFLLNLLNILSLEVFLLVFALQLLLLTQKRNPLKLPNFTLTEISIIALFLIIAIVFHLFTFTHITYWNGFYERQSNTLADNFQLQTFDSLSYLGRAMTYIPGYFFLNASFQWLFSQSFSFLLLFANIFFLFSFASLGNKLNLKEKSLPFALLVATSLFILTGLTLSPRHAISLSFFALALTLLLDKKPLPAGLTIGTAAFIQIPMLAFYPFFYLLMFYKKENLKPFLKSLATGILLFALLFIPQLLQFGMPYEVKSSDWGYLITHSPEYLIGDIPALIAFFFIFFAYDYLKTRKKLSKTAGRLALATGIGIIIQFFITYRWNVMTAISLASFIAYEFPARIFNDKQSRILILIILAMVFAPLLTTMSYYSMAGISKQPIETVSLLSSSEDNILSDPLFAHSIAYLSNRKTLADLYVEYADEEKLEDAYSFLRTQNTDILEKYNISLILNQRDFIHSKAIGAKPLNYILEFPNLDKIYNNGFIFIHRNIT